jgi:hypothetical protein
VALIAPAGALAQGGPAAQFDSGPQDPVPTNDATPVFEFSAPSDPAATFECALGSATPAPCSSPYTTDPLADGAYHLEVRAFDAAMNPGDPATRDFTIDTTPPETVIVSAPPARTTERNPAVEFMAGPGEAAASFECSLDNGAFAACTSPWRPGTLALGAHRIEVRALDALGNADATPALADFTVAETAPPVQGSGGSGKDVNAGLQALAAALVANLDRVARELSTSEMPAILDDRRLAVPGVRALVPGTLTVQAATPARRGSPRVLTGKLTFPFAGRGVLSLRPTKTGRAMLRRYSSLPLLLKGTFASQGLSMSVSRQARLVRDWLTTPEARRAVARAIRRDQGTRPKRLAVKVRGRCGSGCLRVRAEWLRRGRHLHASGRARQVDGRLAAKLSRPAAG